MNNNNINKNGFFKITRSRGKRGKLSNFTLSLYTTSRIDQKFSENIPYISLVFKCTI